MAVINGVSVLELRDGLSESITFAGGPAASKSYLVPNWYDRYSVANGLLAMIQYNINGSGKLNIVSPGSYPDSPNAVAQEITIRGVGSISQGPNQIAWTSAIVSVNYGVPKYDITPQPQQGYDPAAPMVFASQAIKFGGHYITIPRSSCKLADGTALNQDVGRFVGVNQLTLTLHYFPYLVTASMRSLIGQMNTATIFGASTGTLMLTGIDTNRTAATDGTLTQETMYAFQERPEAAWDKVFGTNGWTQVQQTGTTTSILKSGDYTQLIPGFYRGA